VVAEKLGERRRAWGQVGGRQPPVAGVLRHQWASPRSDVVAVESTLLPSGTAQEAEPSYSASWASRPVQSISTGLRSAAAVTRYWRFG
jgi:hypothetical protein